MKKNLVFTTELNENITMLDAEMRMDKSFDLVGRGLRIGPKNAKIYFVDGMVKDAIMAQMMSFAMNLPPEKVTGADTARSFADLFLPYIETDVTADVSKFIATIFSGAVGMLVEGYPEAIIIDSRTYPARSVAEPENDKVLRGPHEGFVETLTFNTALIRRRVRDTGLTMDFHTVGIRSKTDVVICYLEGKADPKVVKNLQERIEQITINSLAMGQESLKECLVPKQRYNPFPKVRYTERPDSVASCIYEGRVVILVDNTPVAMIVPTGIFDFLQDTNDYYFPPLIGSYLRMVRMILFALTLLLTPVWFLLIQNPEFIPEWMSFIIYQQKVTVPITLQLIIVEFVIDALRLASLNTPSSLSSSFSILGALILGEMAVTAKWLDAEVVLYMAFVAITNLAQPSFELGYAFKLSRMLMIILTAMFNIWGFLAALLIMLILIVTNKTVSGKSYLYPLIPFNFKALTSLLFRKPISFDNS